MPACPRCGAIVDENDNFCMECGLSLTTESTTPSFPTSISTSPPQKVSVLTNVLFAFTTLFTSRDPLVRVTGVAYEKLPPPRVAQSWKLIIIAVALFAGFYILEFGEEAYPIIDGNLMYFVSTYAVAFLFLLWVYRSDKYERDPFRFILALFAWGVFSGLLAGPLNTVFGSMFGNEALVAPFVEEPLKALGLFLLVRHKIWGK